CANSLDVSDAAVSGRVCAPTGIAFDPASRSLYIGDRNNARIIRVTLTATKPSASPRPLYRFAGSPNGTSSCCGNGLQARAALLNGPDGLSVDSNGNVLFGDRSNLRARQIDISTGII